MLLAKWIIKKVVGRGDSNSEGRGILEELGEVVGLVCEYFEVELAEEDGFGEKEGAVATTALDVLNLILSEDSDVFGIRIEGKKVTQRTPFFSFPLRQFFHLNINKYFKKWRSNLISFFLEFPTIKSNCKSNKRKLNHNSLRKV